MFKRVHVYHHRYRAPHRINIAGVPVVGYFGLFFVQLMESWKLLNAWFFPGSVALVTLVFTMAAWRIAVWIRNREPIASFFGILCFVGVWFCIMPLFRLWSHQHGLVQTEVFTTIAGAILIDTLWNETAPARRLLRKLRRARSSTSAQQVNASSGNALRISTTGRNDSGDVVLLRQSLQRAETTIDGLRADLKRAPTPTAPNDLQAAYDQLQAENATLRDKLSGAETMIAALSAKVLRQPHDERPSLDIVPNVDLGPDVRLSVPNFDDVPRLGNTEQ